MKKRIVVEYGKISQISKDFKVTRQAVYKALNYLSNSSKATLIRKVAIERGGFDYKAKVLCVVFLLEFLFFVYNR